ncbi:hypothetical protein K439DRAFT_1618519 [Ramaria rubella]|nr:hypothetical protein K439DRAFT_1618519 [Ramaria rubella]
MTARLTQLTTLHIDQSPGITPAVFMALMQSPRLHMVFLVEVDGYRLLVNTGVSKSIRELFLLDCKHIAPVLGHCPRLLTLEVHERPILHNCRGGGRVYLPGGLCGLPDIGPLLPRSLQHLTLNTQGWPEDVYLRWHENPMVRTDVRHGGGVALPSLKHLVLGSKQLRENEDSAISKAGVEALCHLFSSDSVKTLRLYSRFPLSAVTIACMGACWPFLEDVGLTVAPLRLSGRSPELGLALYMDNHGDHPFVPARADAGEPLGELDVRLCALALGTNVRLHHVAVIHGAGPSVMVHCRCVCVDTGDPVRTQQHYTSGESVGGWPARKVAHSFGLSDPAVRANPGWVMSPAASVCLHKCQQGSVGVGMGGWLHVVVESREGHLVYGTRRVRPGWQ